MSEVSNQNDKILNSSPGQDDELTLREVIMLLMDYWRELWKKKWWIIALTIPFILYFGYKSHKKPVEFKADLTYLLFEGASGGSMSSILGSLGLGGGNNENLLKIVELSKSRRIMQKVLFTPFVMESYGSEPDYIANHIIRLYDLGEQWTTDKNDYTDFVFVTDSIENFTGKELSAFKRLLTKVIGSKRIKEPIFINAFDWNSGILTMSVTLMDEDLAVEFCDRVFDELKEFYTLTATRRTETSYLYVKQKTDSIYSELSAKEYQLSKFNDSHRNLTDPKLVTQRRLIETEILKLKAMYAEVTKNQELADFSLTSVTPDISIIDRPLPPLPKIQASLMIELIKGIILGGFIGVTFFVGRKLVLDALREG